MILSNRFEYQYYTILISINLQLFKKNYKLKNKMIFVIFYIRKKKGF
jgi:hypothetical protein